MYLMYLNTLDPEANCVCDVVYFSGLFILTGSGWIELR